MGGVLLELLRKANIMSHYVVGDTVGDESTYALESDEEYTRLYVYPEKQIRMDGHPEITHILTIEPWGNGNLMLTLRQPVRTTQ